MSQRISKEVLDHLRNRYGYSKRKYKSPGLCNKCGPDWIFENFEEGHVRENCRNPPFCGYHDTVGHTTTEKCKRLCHHCMKWGHSMRFCRKLKTCNLCGKFGHNPYSCWKYSTLRAWADRAKELNRCMVCLTLCTTETNYIDKNGHPEYKCKHCGTWRTYWNGDPQYIFQNYKESQTETNTEDQEIKTELLQAKKNNRKAKVTNK